MRKSIKSNRSKSNHLSTLKMTHAGIDVGSAEIYVCIANRNNEQIVKSFSTFTSDLKRMIQWLLNNSIKSVAMESTGVYWIPIFELLEQAKLEVLLVNARHLKNVPGRKTDVLDCQWIQELHSYGLLRGSFRPKDDYIELRSYVRQRSRLYQLAGSQVQLMHKALTLMNLQINHVLSDITGKTGTKIIQSILAGEIDPEKLASCRDERCTRDRETITKALEGNYRSEHIFALRQAYNGYEFFHKQIIDCEQEIEKILEQLNTKNGDGKNLEKPKEYRKTPYKRKTSYNRSPYFFDASQSLINLLKVDLTTIPGIDIGTIIKVISEIGTDMSRWKSVKHFCSWLGLSPGNKISGGKILSSRTKPTNNQAASALRLAAHTLYRSSSALGAYFRRMRARLGAPKAITATAHKLARILYRLLSEPQRYREYGENYYEKQYKSRMIKRLKRQAQEFGFELKAV